MASFLGLNQLHARQSHGQSSYEASRHNYGKESSSFVAANFCCSIDLFFSLLISSSLLHTMSALEIDAPTRHDIFFTPYGETYSPSLSGVVSLRPSCFENTTAPLVSILLMRLITISTKSSTMRQIVRRKQRPPAFYTEVVACTETSRSTRSIKSTEGHHSLVFEFALSVPTSLSPTTHTTIATTSYALIVHAKTEAGKTIEVHHNMQICRTMVPSAPLVFDHFRKFQRMPFMTRLFLSPKHLPDLTSNNQLDGTTLLEAPLIRRGRPSEIKVVVVREVRWSVAEAVEVSHKHPSSLDAGPEKRYMRTICEGKTRGNWTPEDMPRWRDDNESLIRTKVPFHILVQKATNDMELLCPQSNDEAPFTSACAKVFHHKQQIAISVSHRLRLEIVIGEDTLIHRTEALVDRKPVRHCLGATYPLHIGPVAYDAPIPEGAFEVSSELPGYEDLEKMPPAYGI